MDTNVFSVVSSIISTVASIASALLTAFGIAFIVFIEWYRHPRLRVRPSDDQPDEEWIHLTVWNERPIFKFLPREMAISCVARIRFLDPRTGDELVGQIDAHWVSQPEPESYGDVATVTKRDVGFREERIDILRRTPDGTAYAADPWIIYSPPLTSLPADVRTKLEGEWEKRRLKQREFRVIVEVGAANGATTTTEFLLVLPESGLQAVRWLPYPAG